MARNGNLLKTVVSNAAGGVVAALVILLGGVAWSWVAEGSLVSLLGGATRQQMYDHVQTGTFFVNGRPALAGGAPADSGRRTVSQQVKFHRAFSKPPSVTLSTHRLDTWKHANTRITLDVTDITEEHFVVTTSTWGDSRVYSIGGSWVAVAKPEP